MNLQTGLRIPGRPSSVPPEKDRSAHVRPRSRLLIVDDTIPILEMFEEFFRASEFSVTLARSGEEAVKHLEAQEFDVVVTDLQMKPMTGLDLLRYIKRGAYPLTEVIVLTGYASLESSMDALRFDVFDYVEKPVNLDKFERIIRNAAEKKRLASENLHLIQLLNEQNERLEQRVREVTRELEELSIRDALTGLYNYRYFSNIVVAEVSRSIRYHRPLSLVMLDLDRFKRFNDTFGHQKGNEALIEVGKILVEQTRENDICVRYGGEEFAILCPETDRHSAFRIADRIRARLHESSISGTPDLGPESIVLSLSAGVAECPLQAENDRELLEWADVALYRAKGAGRNRVEIFCEVE